MSEPTTSGPPAITYADVSVELTGVNGNVFVIIGTVAKALRHHIGHEAATAYTNAATACGSYDEVLQLTMRTVDVR